jgi:DNA polymerase III gamma/tau subunit
VSLYQKHRPQNLDNVIGNIDVITYLREALADKKTCPHVFLLSGPTGCGKTTLARIISKDLDCDPVDMKEINAASFRGIDTVREMINSANYFSMGGGSRVWLIDEIHKMTNDAQNALLKLLEDSPKHSYYILCTTEPEKLLPTLRGRCVDLPVKPLNENEMMKLLRTVVKGEGKKVAISVYEQIVRDSLGLPRNAIQILEKVIKVPEVQQLEIAKQSAVQYSESIQLCRALFEKAGWKKISTILTGLKQEDPESIRRQVLGYCQSILLKQENDRAAFVIEIFQEPLYNIGFPGLVLACYSVVKG